MSKIESLRELVLRGEQILRISKPHERNFQWREWYKQVLLIKKDIPETKTLGLRLKLNYLAADIGMLSRLERFLSHRLENGETTESPMSKPTSNKMESRQKAVKVTRPSADKSEDQTIKIFISHKQGDERTARGVKSAIERYGAGMVEIFLSEDIAKGANWIEWIRDKLMESNILLLLFTDATRSWDWCLYEAGLFTYLDDLQKRPVICLHSAQLLPPAPLRHLQAVPAVVQQVRIFLKQLFVEAKLKGLSRPLNFRLAEQPEELERAAEEIVALVSRHLVKSDFFSNYLYLSFSDDASESIPSDAMLKSDSGTMEIFGLKEGEWTWGDIVAQTQDDGDQRWLEELTRSISIAGRGKLFEPIQATLRARRGGKRYRPILYRVDTLADGLRVYKILFSEDVSWHGTEIPKKLATLSTALIMAIRFRYEVLKRYMGNISEAEGFRSGNDLYQEMLQTISNIEMEASSKGVLDEKELLSVFDKTEMRQQVKEMYGKYYTIKEVLFGIFDRNDGKLLEDKLSDLLKMNQKFISLGSQRFSDLVSQER